MSRKTFSAIASAILLIANVADAQPFGGQSAPGGLVVLTVSTNGEPAWPSIPAQLRRRPTNPPFHSVLFERLGSDPDVVDGSASIGHIAGTSTGVFRTKLAPGHYRLKAFQAVWRGGNMEYTYTWPIHEGMSDFEIVAGKLTDLGDLIFHEEVPGERGFTLGFSSSNPAARTAILEVLPESWSAASMAEPLTWSSPNWQLGERIRQAIAQRSEFVINPRLLADGSIVAGSSVGQILVRSAQGAWARYDTGVSSQIRSAAYLKDGRLLAGGEMNTLLVSNPAATKWSPVRFPFVGLVEWIDQRPDGSIMALIGDDETTTLIRTYSIDAPSWVPVSQFKNPYISTRSINDLIQSTRSQQDPRLVQQRSDLLSLQLANGMSPVLDLKTGQFRRAKKLETAGFRPSSTSIADDGSVFLLLNTPKKDGLAVSHDQGATWKATEIKLHGRVTRVHFASRQVGFRFVTADRYDPYDAPVEVQTTSDGGKTWEPACDLPYLRYVWELGNGRFLGSAEKLDGRAVWITNDAGRTWARERLP